MHKITVTVDGSQVKILRDDQAITFARFELYREDELAKFIRGYILMAISDLQKTEADVLRRTQGG